MTVLIGSKGSSQKPYSKPITRKCFCYSQLEHCSDECPTQKFVNMVEGDDLARQDKVEENKRVNLLKVMKETL